MKRSTQPVRGPPPHASVVPLQRPRFSRGQGSSLKTFSPSTLSPFYPLRERSARELFAPAIVVLRRPSHKRVVGQDIVDQTLRGGVRGVPLPAYDPHADLGRGEPSGGKIALDAPKPTPKSPDVGFGQQRVRRKNAVAQEAVRRLPVVAVRGSSVPRVVVPRAATKNAGRSTGPRTHKYKLSQHSPTQRQAVRGCRVRVPRRQAGLNMLP